jgi:nicotinamide riboside kinase
LDFTEPIIHNPVPLTRIIFNGNIISIQFLYVYFWTTLLEKISRNSKMKQALKIAFTGPESSGKSTLSSWLSAEIKLPLIEEYAREYLTEKKEYFQEDLDSIARGQMNLWSKESNFIADTEMTVLKVWSEVKYDSCSELIQKLFDAQCFDVYFLCTPDIPWEEDPLRENPNDRNEIFDHYLKLLEEQKVNYKIISGDLEDRKQQVLNYLRDHQKAVSQIGAM